MSNSREYWFKRKRYGWGYTPVTWHGWLTVVIFFVLCVSGAVAMLPKESAASSDTLIAAKFAVFIGFNTAIMLIISLAKGPKPYWRWGKKPGDNPKEDY